MAADRRPVRLVGAAHTNPAYPAQQGGRSCDGVRARRGLVLLDGLADDPLIRQRERAVRAHLLELNGETQQAAKLYREAAALTSNLAERRYLEGRAQHLES